MSLYDEPELKAYLEHAEKEMLPKMRGSALCISINTGKPDIKQMLEIGAAICYDKPLILVAIGDEPIPANLKRVASAIVIGNPTDPAVQQKLQDAIAAVLKNDRRAK